MWFLLSFVALSLALQPPVVRSDGFFLLLFFCFSFFFRKKIGWNVSLSPLSTVYWRCYDTGTYERMHTVGSIVLIDGYFELFQLKPFHSDPIFHDMLFVNHSRPFTILGSHIHCNSSTIHVAMV